MAKSSTAGTRVWDQAISTSKDAYVLSWIKNTVQQSRASSNVQQRADRSMARKLEGTIMTNQELLNNIISKFSDSQGKTPIGFTYIDISSVGMVQNFSKHDQSVADMFVKFKTSGKSGNNKKYVLKNIHLSDYEKFLNLVDTCRTDVAGKVSLFDKDL
jgi:hypothetical protein